ncbi:MAG: hypothetical protein A2W31_13405 [Planctomycetes bacterium RBG_16_64_10]|nr:MAG: hypothetical protein A2W31_13405 [Planctomycetes bacterium RBG_16_64_10]
MPTLQPITSVLRSLWPRPRDPSALDYRIVAAVRSQAETYRGCTDQQLRTGTETLRAAVGNGRHLISPEVTVPGFALVCEATRRLLGMEFFDVQLLAGLALSRKAIAEMHTGEGKTLVAALPAFVYGLTSAGAHVMTVNTYLAERDYQLLAPVYRLLGLTVGSLRAHAPADEKRAAYACDVTYGPGYEFGFDYLRDQTALLARRRQVLGASYLRALRGELLPQSSTVQRGHPFAIVDEIDSVLLDEATTPLILSEGARRLARNAGIYIAALRAADRLAVGDDYVVDPAHNLVQLTDRGQQRIQEDLAKIPRQGLQRPWATYLEQALRARTLLRRDVDYIVEQEKILLVDKSTGRIFADRTLRLGLHQAIEALEQVPITAEQQPLARISRQRYFRLYGGLCGMTGTATGNEREFWAFYRLPVVRIPRRKPCHRHNLPTRFFTDRAAKMAAIAADVQHRTMTGQPILVGTRTIQQSVQLAQRFDQQGIPYQLLNGTQDAEEAEIVARAGQTGAVTIATNMAGRGTDIKLGTGVEARGGLHVIVSEPHESTRVDRQLIGRSARQGDPGSAQRFVAADDALIREHGPALGQQMRRLAGAHGEIPTDLSGPLLRLQRQVERLAYLRRQQLFAHDDWLDEVLARLAKDE